MPPRSFPGKLAATLVCALVLSSFALASDVAGERTVTKAPVPLPFEPTEQLVYEGEFSKLLLRGIKIAELRFTAGRKATTVASLQPGIPGPSPDAPLFLTGDVETKGWFQKLFGINFRFHVESTVASDASSVLRTSKVDEQGKRVRTSEAVFDRAANRVEWTERDPNDQARPPRVVTTPLEGTAHDIVSAIYFLRTQDLTPGRTIRLTVSDSGQVYHLPAQVFAEKKKMKSVLGKVPVVRVDIGLFGKDRPVAGEGRMSLWVTQDARRIPVRAKMSNEMGTLEIMLKSVGKAAAQQ